MLSPPVDQFRILQLLWIFNAVHALQMDDAFVVRVPLLAVLAIVRCGCDMDGDADDGPFGDDDNDERVALITQLSDKFFFTLLYWPFNS